MGMIKFSDDAIGSGQNSTDNNQRFGNFIFEDHTLIIN